MSHSSGRKCHPEKKFSFYIRCEKIAIGFLSHCITVLLNSMVSVVDQNCKIKTAVNILVDIHNIDTEWS